MKRSAGLLVVVGLILTGCFGPFAPDDADPAVDHSPAAPSNPSPADGATEVLPGVTLDWADAQHATSYDVYLRSGRASFLRVAEAIGSSSYETTNVTFGSNYEWYVVAHNAEYSTQGPTWAFTTQTNNLSYQLGGYWTFDSTLGDSSGFGHHGSWRPEPAFTHLVPGSSPVYTTDRDGQRISAVGLSGQYSQYVEVSLAGHEKGPLANHSTGFSLSLWYRELASNTDALLVTRGSLQAGYELVLTSDEPLAWVANGATRTTVPVSALGSGWNHIVISWDFATERLRIWANGSLVRDLQLAAFANTTNPIYFGPSYNQTTFNGALDDIRIYYRPISETEAQALFSE